VKKMYGGTYTPNRYKSSSPLFYISVAFCFSVFFGGYKKYVEVGVPSIFFQLAIPARAKTNALRRAKKSDY
jgi:lipopolysaccharide export LptBFGC system permease protein LptF